MSKPQDATIQLLLPEVFNSFTPEQKNFQGNAFVANVQGTCFGACMLAQENASIKIRVNAPFVLDNYLHNPVIQELIVKKNLTLSITDIASGKGLFFDKNTSINQN